MFKPCELIPPHFMVIKSLSLWFVFLNNFSPKQVKDRMSGSLTGFNMSLLYRRLIKRD